MRDTMAKINELDKDATICFLSADTQFLIKQLRKKCETQEQKELLSLISQKVRTIQHKAQKMEKRLGKYRNHIEALGFVRKK